MKNVPLLAPAPEAAQALRKNYSGLVTAALLAEWAAHPASAPGRRTSSPWPDRIEIAQPGDDDGKDADVTGRIIEASSTGEAPGSEVLIHLKKEQGRWLISAFNEKSEVQESPAIDSAEAVSVVRSYYDLIGARDYQGAWKLWGETGPPGQTLETFMKGFAETIAVKVDTGTPSAIEGAAGSRYITVPVTVEATRRDGMLQKFQGSYVLRRAVVDGASEAQRRWHLYRGELRSIGSS